MSVGKLSACFSIKSYELRIMSWYDWMVVIPVLFALIILPSDIQFSIKLKVTLFNNKDNKNTAITLRKSHG